MAEPLPHLDTRRIRLLSRIGEGGMASVYRAWDEVLRVERAVKLLSPALSLQTSARQRFIDEARTMALLRHPNIVTVHDVRIGTDRPFMVMELMRGGTLAERIARHGPLPPAQAAAIVQALASALSYAHQQGVIHRDIKPQNVLLSAEGTPYLTDFGIAQVRSRGPRTRTGVQLGTWAYMSPEQREDASQVDQRTDIYALGALLYSLVSGKPPLDLHSTEIREPALIDIDPHIADIIRDTTRARRGDRIATAEALSDALRDISDLLPTPPPDTPPLACPPEQSTSASATFVFEPAAAAAASAAAPPPPKPPPPPPAKPLRRSMLQRVTVGAGLVAAGLGLGWLTAQAGSWDADELPLATSLGHVAVRIPGTSGDGNVELLCLESGYRDIDPLEDREAFFSDVPEEPCVLRLLRSDGEEVDAWHAPVLPNTALTCIDRGERLECGCVPFGGECPAD